MKLNDDTFVVHLTIQQLKEIIQEVITTSTLTTPPKFESTVTERGTRIVGIKQLAKYIGCGVNTAQRLKDEGKVPYSQIGNRFYFVSNEIDVSLRNMK